MEDIFKWVDNSFKLFALEKADLPLEVLIFISILEVFWTNGMIKEFLVVLRNNIFANSLISTTVQDSSKKERSNVEGLANKFHRINIWIFYNNVLIIFLLSYAMKIFCSTWIEVVSLLCFI